MTTKRSGRKCRKGDKESDERKQMSVIMPRGLIARLDKMAANSHRKRAEQVRFLLEGVLPPLADLEFLAKKKARGCTSTAR